MRSMNGNLEFPVAPVCVCLSEWEDVDRSKKGRREESKKERRKEKRFFKPHSCSLVSFFMVKENEMTGGLLSLDRHMSSQNADSLRLVCGFRVAG